jgi:hypothetical protein
MINRSLFNTGGRWYTNSGFRPEVRGAADDDMQTYQGTEVGGWVERVLDKVPVPLLAYHKNIACEIGDVALFAKLAFTLSQGRVRQ